MLAPLHSAAAAGRRRRRRWQGLLGSLVLMAVGVALPVGARLIFDDAYLRRILVEQLQARLHLPVALGGLQLQLRRGLTLTDLRIGPPPGFQADLLQLASLHLRWRLRPLLRGQFALRELRLQGLSVTVERGEAGYNLDRLGGGGQAIASPVAGPAASVAAAPRWDLDALVPDLLPVACTIERLEIVDLAGRYISPTQQVEVHDLRLTGSLRALDRRPTFDLSLRWQGDAEQPPGLQLRGAAGSLSLQPQLTLQIIADGSGGWALHAGGEAQLGARRLNGPPLPPLPLHLALHLQAEARAQRLDLERLWLQLGSSFELTAAAALEMRSTPAVELRVLQLDLKLAELASRLQLLWPELDLRGRLQLQSQPQRLPLAHLMQPASLAASAELSLSDLHLGLGPDRLQGGQGRLQLQLAAAALHLTGDLKVGQLEGLQRGAAAAQQRLSLRDLALQGELTLPLARLQGAAGAAPVAVQLHLTGGGGALSAALAPAGGPGLAPGGRLASWRTTSLDLEGHLDDLVDKIGAGSLGLEVIGLSLPGRGDEAELPPLRLQLQLQRRGDRLEIGRSSLRLGPHLRLTTQGALKLGSVLQLEQLQIALAPLPLGAALALLPSAQRPTATLSGELGAELNLDGRLDPVALATLMPPAWPADAGPDDPAWRAGVAAYGHWLAVAAARLEGGLGLNLRGHLWLRGVAADAPNWALNGLDGQLHLSLDPHGPDLQQDLQIAQLSLPLAQHRGLALQMEARLTGDILHLGATAAVADLDGPTPLHGVQAQLTARYPLGGDLTLETMTLQTAAGDLQAVCSGRWQQPLASLASAAWQRPGMPGLSLQLHSDLTLRRPAAAAGASAEAPARQLEGWQAWGTTRLQTQLSLTQGGLHLTGSLGLEAAGLAAGTRRLEGVTGSLPFAVDLLFGRRADALVLRRDLVFGGGVLSLVSAADDLRERPPRPAYYDRMLPYRQGQGLSVRRLQQGPFAAEDLALEVRLVDGMLLVDRVALRVLGGDLVGHMGYQLGRDNSVRGSLGFKLSHVDAATFPALKLQPGPNSELSGDLQLSFLLGEGRRDMNMNMNLTQVGARALDRFLQLLDPDDRNARLQQTRKNLGLIRIDGLQLWSRFEQLNLDLNYQPMVRIPFTSIGYRPIERAVLRRYSLTDFLDTYLQPSVHQLLAPALGWRDAT